MCFRIVSEDSFSEPRLSFLIIGPRIHTVLVDKSLCLSLSCYKNFQLVVLSKVTISRLLCFSFYVSRTRYFEQTTPHLCVHFGLDMSNLSLDRHPEWARYSSFEIFLAQVIEIRLIMILDQAFHVFLLRSIFLGACTNVVSVFEDLVLGINCKKLTKDKHR